MTDTKLLEEKLRLTGLTKNQIAKQLGLSRSGLYLKTVGKRSFNQTELSKLADLLKIKSMKEFNDIFFANNVDKI